MSDTETNGNGGVDRVNNDNGSPHISHSSAEDLSEYTDADESISAPTEFLAEFLSAVMLKDYESALTYCKLILQYEPNNVTAKEFYPLIIEKLQTQGVEESDSEESSESESSSSYSSTSDSSDDNEDKPTDSDATTASYSSLEDDEVDQENNEFNPTDVTNGNTGQHKSRINRRKSETQLTEAIQKKLEGKTQNRNAIRLALEKDLHKIMKKPSEEVQSPESDCSPWEKSPDSEYGGWGKSETSPESESSRWDDKSGGSEVFKGCPFSSHPESPTDPNPKLNTVQEIPSLNNKNSF